jgi:hypothetical protein
MNIKINQVSKALANAAAHVELITLLPAEIMALEIASTGDTHLSDAISKLLQGHKEFLKHQQLVVDVEVNKKKNYEKFQCRVNFYRSRGHNHSEAVNLARKWMNEFKRNNPL